ncbi:MAG: hypothetical protein AWT59_1888 [Candidatus Gallionella acididurans]|uniref:Uncharacterized protein n=1 Tax=Candidatus Gallionella acididurans TaxID=1796491 RepID=A0A139BSL1_9PROT|nr:MAG: hypothetical protein AWT59_1888 [Candidatus Gallionella acididurans]
MKRDVPIRYCQRLFATQEQITLHALLILMGTCKLHLKIIQRGILSPYSGNYYGNGDT